MRKHCLNKPHIKRVHNKWAIFRTIHASEYTIPIVIRNGFKEAWEAFIKYTGGKV